MRLLRILLLCLLSAPAAFSQPKPIVQDMGNLGLHVASDLIRWHKYLETKNQLLLVGYKTLQVIDLTSRKVLETRPVILPSLETRGDYSLDDWVINPDGRRMLIVGHPEARYGLKQAAWVWDLQEGKRVAILDKSPGRIRTGVWSRNGKTLITFDDEFENSIHEFSFWDGESFEYRGSVPVENVTWWHLSDDGRRFLIASGKKKSMLGMKYVSDQDGVINVWDATTGQIEKTISVGDNNYSPRTSKMMVSPDDSYLVLVNEYKGGASEHKLLAWEISGSVSPKYEIKPQPKIDNSRVSFSPDGKYFALDVGKNLQIYETRTGKMRSELQGVEWSNTWLNDDVILDVQSRSWLSKDKSDRMEAVDIPTGKVLYEQKLEYREERIYNPLGDDETALVYSQIRPHPNGEIFVKYDEEYVRIFDSRTGELLQTVISPPIKYDKNGKPKLSKDGTPKLSHGAAIRSAYWSGDGKTLYVFSANRQSVSLWGLVEKSGSQ